jgi:hypothetical protein
MTRTDNHPDGESDQSEDAELEDEIDIDGNGDRRDERQAWSHEHYAAIPETIDTSVENTDSTNRAFQRTLRSAPTYSAVFY